MNQFKTPILFIVFNRLETTKLVFEKIKQIKAEYLFIAADGPRKDTPEDKAKTTEVRQYLESHINWPCNLNTLFHKENLGCGLGPAKAITWFFEHVEEGIILEDDCLPDISFFYFCEELLEKYRKNNNISIISGCNFDTNRLYTPENQSYFYSAIPYTWGWATWKRNWIQYDYKIKKWKKINRKKFLKNIFAEIEYQLYWKNIFSSIYNNVPKDIWDYQFFFSCFYNKQVSIVSKKNLITNIGFGLIATHTIDPNDNRANQKLHTQNFPLDHPKLISRNYNYDRFLQQLCYGRIEYIPINKKVKILIKKVLRNILFVPVEKFLLIILPELHKLKTQEYDFGLLKSYQEDCRIDELAIVNKIFRLKNVTIGKRTYVAQNSTIQFTEIGKFCSIGPNFMCGWGIHPTNGISTSPMFYSTNKQNGITLSKFNKVEERKKIVIGNDVYIGMNVTVLDGVTIGDGAIIGAGSIVSKNIPAYAVAIGSPIQIIKYRFNEQQVAKLCKIRWWEFDDDKLLDVERMFFDIDDFINKYNV